MYKYMSQYILHKYLYEMNASSKSEFLKKFNNMCLYGCKTDTDPDQLAIDPFYFDHSQGEIFGRESFVEKCMFYIAKKLIENISTYTIFRLLTYIFF